MGMKKFIYTVLVNLLFVVIGLAQQGNALPQVTRAYAFTNINIVQGPGRKMDNATMIIRDGLIAALGRDIAIPSDAIIIKADSMYAYAGFIDGLCKAGVRQRYTESTEKLLDPASPPPAMAGITPQREARTMLNQDDKEIEELRNLGFTTVQLVPSGNFLPGHAAIILTSDKTTHEMVLISRSAMYSDLVGTRGVYPSTVLGIMAKWRELYQQALLAKSYDQMYVSNPAGLPRPVADPLLEAFYPVIDQHEPVLFKSQRLMDIHRVLSLKSDLGFSLIIADVKEGWPVIAKVKTSGTKVFLSLDLPEEKKIDGSKEKPETFEGIEKDELEKRKAESTRRCTAQASDFQKAGIPFGFCTYSAKVKDIPANLRRMIAAGLSEDEALAALTTTPAKILGLSDRMGTVDVGKIANLVISDKSYFQGKAKVQYVVVDGKVYPVETREAVKIEGGWTIVIQTSRGKVSDRINLRKEGNGYAGTYFSEMLQAPIDLSDVSLKGNQLSFKYKMGNTPDSPQMTVEAVVAGKTFKGVINGARYKNIVIEGILDAKN